MPLRAGGGGKGILWSPVRSPSVLLPGRLPASLSTRLGLSRGVQVQARPAKSSDSFPAPERLTLGVLSWAKTERGRGGVSQQSGSHRASTGRGSICGNLDNYCSFHLSSTDRPCARPSGEHVEKERVSTIPPGTPRRDGSCGQPISQVREPRYSEPSTFAFT